MEKSFSRGGDKKSPVLKRLLELSKVEGAVEVPFDSLNPPPNDIDFLDPSLEISFLGTRYQGETGSPIVWYGGSEAVEDDVEANLFNQLRFIRRELAPILDRQDTEVPAVEVIQETHTDDDETGVLVKFALDRQGTITKIALSGYPHLTYEKKVWLDADDQLYFSKKVIE
ncbi:MAG: hypothetical protein ABH851_09070 [Methanobacteriota archaeon]